MEKVFGQKTLIFYCIMICFTIAIGSIIAYYGNIYAAGTVLLMSIGLLQVVNKPLIRVGNNRFSIATLMPFNKNINIALNDIHSITIEHAMNTNFILYMKDGSTLYARTGSYTLNMEPLRKALQETGIPVQLKSRTATNKAF